MVVVCGMVYGVKVIIVFDGYKCFYGCNDVNFWCNV